MKARCHTGVSSSSLLSIRLAGALLLGAVLSACAPPAHFRTPSPNACSQHAFSLQVLGSGGPIADDERASSAYLLWLDGAARVLVDIGGGAFQRFGASGATLETLDLVALSHLHTDHSADLPALLKGAYFSQRQRPLAISGPSGGNQFPALDDYLQALFHPQRGAYRYLNGLLDGSDGLFALQTHTLPAEPGQQHRIALPAPLQVSALGVHHGIVPALAYRISDGQRSVVFAGDQSAFNPAMPEFAAAADVLVAHVAIPPRAGRGAQRLHRTPAAWAQLAATAGVRTLVLSHWMQRSLKQRPAVLAAIKENYSGQVIEATDYTCIML